MQSYFFILSFLFFFGFISQGQESLDLKREADVSYKLEEFEKAEELYRRSLAIDYRAETAFNLGNTLYQLGKYEEAAAYFSEAKDAFSEMSQKSNAAHNLGNTHFEKMELEKALNAFQESLIYNPANEDARNNYLLAKELMQMMPPQESRDQGDEGQPPPEQGDEDSEAIAEETNAQDEDENDTEVEGNGETADAEREFTSDDLEGAEVAEQNIDQSLIDQLLQLAEEEDQRTQRKMNEQRRQPSQILRDW